MTRETDCAAAMRQLWDFLDAELTVDRMSAIQMHLERCSSCYPEYNFQKVFLEAVASTRNGAPAPEELRARIVAALAEAGFRCRR